MTVFTAWPRRALTGLAFAGAVLLAPDPVRADTPAATGDSAPPSTPAQVKAQDHYKKARELYQSGSYHEASVELEAALALDPEAKELVFNLGVVSEKLGKIDDALRHFRHYAQMNLTPAERQRVDGYIKRLEGAKNEVAPPPPVTPPPADDTKKTEKIENGRIDTATLVTASIAVVGLGVGTVFGIKALSDKPKAGYVTGQDGSYADLQHSADRSHTEAIAADIGFGIGIVAAAVTAYLYFARPKILAPAPSRATLTVTPIVTPTPGGGAFVLRGSF